mgnify:CR=1 FL=1
MPKKKFYVVWRGNVPGIYTDWETCCAQVLHFPAARYKAFATQAEAEAAFAAGVPEAKAGSEATAATPKAKASSTPTKARKAAKPRQRGTSAALPPNPPSWRHDTVLPLPQGVEAQAIAVDAACSGNPGAMEYRGVCLTTGATLFHYGPVYGTNNIGEFLAIVHALALMQQKGITDKVIYSDSVNAQLWVSKKQCKTKLERTPQTEQLYQVIARAENWLRTHPINIPIIKWETKKWGEIPADFGRKG